MGTDGLNARFIERGVDIKSFQHGIFKEHTDQRFLELVRDWCEATLRVQTPPSPEASMECDYEPRSAQERQLRGWRTFLTDNWNVIQSSTVRSARAQMSMWCGTGKTFTAFLMIREFIDKYTARVTNEAATIIYFVPSLWLMGQTYKSFCCQCIRNEIEHWNWVLIGSDIDRQTTQGTETAFELQLSTKIDEISDHLKNRRPDGHNIIISTYNSWNKCAGALKKVQLRPDLVIYDEAHRTAGSIDQDSKQCILDEHFPCRVRLFMTATPKDVMIGDGELGDNEFRRDIVNSMDDPERYGELIADQYTQADAADAGDIVKSKVIALMTDDDMLRNYFDDQKLVVPVANISPDDTDEEDEANVHTEHQHIREHIRNDIAVDDRLRGQGLRRVSMPADGHCQFHALAHQLDFNYLELRERAAEEISNTRNQSLYRSWLGGRDGCVL